MKRLPLTALATGLGICVFVVTACAPTSPPAPVAAMPTTVNSVAALGSETATVAPTVSAFTPRPVPSPSDTSTPTLSLVSLGTPTVQASPANTANPTAGATKTFAPTQTPKPTETPAAPTATPIPVVSWTSPVDLQVIEFEDGNTSWETGSPWSHLTDNRKGVTVEKVIHPVLGPSLKYTVNQTTGPEDSFRLYPQKETIPIVVPVDWTLKGSVVLGPGYLPTDCAGCGVSLASVFDKSERVDGFWHCMLGLNIGSSGKPYIGILHPYGKEGGQPSKFWARYKTREPMVAGRAYSFELTAVDGTISLKVNGTLQQLDKVMEDDSKVPVGTEGDLPVEYRGLAPSFMHSGAYGSGSKEGSEVFFGPMSMDMWITEAYTATSKTVAVPIPFPPVSDMSGLQ